MPWKPAHMPSHPLPEGNHWVQAVAHIRNNETGEIRKHLTEEIIRQEDETGIPNFYNWESGNFSCDCNRQIFFDGTKNEADPFNVECSEGRFSVNLENPVTGDIYYQEFETH